MTDCTKENSNVIIEKQLDEHISGLEKELKADVLAFSGGIVRGMDEAMRDAIEARKSDKDKNRKTLFVVLETKGGYIEVAERMADTFRKHDSRVEFIVPNFAMSAGTVLVMSGDAIHMDYFSVLGPMINK